MATQQKLQSVLSDDEMRGHLEKGGTLLFQGDSRNWQKIERQVERLGFGDLYLVSVIKSSHGDLTKVTPLQK